MKHGPTKKQRIVDVLGDFLIAVAIGFIGGLITFFLFFAPSPAPDPIEAYCRGGVDAAMYYGEFPEEQRADFTRTCIESTRTGVMLPNADGPLR